MHFYLRKTDRRTQSRHVIAADRWVPKLGKGRKISMHPSAIIRSRQVMAPRPSRIIPSWTVRVTQRTWGLVDTTVCLGAVQNEKTENFLPPPPTGIGPRSYSLYLVIYIRRYQFYQNTSKHKKKVLKTYIQFANRHMFRPNMAIIRLCINLNV